MKLRRSAELCLEYPSYAKRRFVSFEEIEGCGKTTQIALLSEYLKTAVHSTHHHAGARRTAVGEGIRKILLKPETIHLTAARSCLLFYASRSQNIWKRSSRLSNEAEMVLATAITMHRWLSGLRPRHPAGFHQQTYGPGCAEYRPDMTLLLDIAPKSVWRGRRARNHGDPKTKDGLRQKTSSSTGGSGTVISRWRLRTREFNLSMRSGLLTSSIAKFCRF